MMINKRLIGTVSESKKYIAGNVAAQWCSLAANIAMMTAVTNLLASLYDKTADKSDVFITASVAASALVIRIFPQNQSKKICVKRFTGSFCGLALPTMSR